MLIDEADIFLQNRTTMTLERNRLVGIFLQRLEHFRGVMILTTNRKGDIDMAILDRMVLQIPYPELSPDAKLGVLRSLLAGIDIATDDELTAAGLKPSFLQRFGQMVANGRQVCPPSTDSPICQLTGGRSPTLSASPPTSLRLPTRYLAALIWSKPCMPAAFDCQGWARTVLICMTSLISGIVV